MSRCDKLLLFLFFLSSCAISKNGIHAQTEAVEPVLARDFSSRQEMCYAYWYQLADDWRRSGGGIKGSISATRENIKDNNSRFATAIRSVWLKQIDYEPNKISDFGQWPIDENKESELRYLLENELVSSVGMDCRSSAWLDSQIWDDLHKIEESELIKNKLLEAPDSMTWDSYYAPRWVIYWLLIRI